MKRPCLLIVWLLAVAAMTTTVVFGQGRGGNQAAPIRPSIPRAADGKPDFTGVWAGPGFSHRVGPGDTDTPRVSNFDPKNMAPFKPGGDALFMQKETGDVLHDDPTAKCLPDGFPRDALHHVQLYQLVGQQLQRPALLSLLWLAAGQRDQIGFLCSIQFA